MNAAKRLTAASGHDQCSSLPITITGHDSMTTVSTSNQVSSPSLAKSGVPRPVTGSQPLTAVNPDNNHSIISNIEEKARFTTSVTTWVRSRRDVVESRLGVGVDERVDESQCRFPSGQTTVIQEGENSCDSLRQVNMRLTAPWMSYRRTGAGTKDASLKPGINNLEIS